jgi:deoxyribonuclease-4
VQEGIRAIIDCLNQAIAKNSGMTILLETMSGKGSEIGYRFEHLLQIIDGVAHGAEIGVCMDLCHVFSSGYDIVNNFEDVLFEFDKIIGLEKLKAVHLNDSRYKFNSQKDGHTPIGQGYIGLDSIVKIMNHPSIRRLPFYLETPLDDEGHRQEINMLKNALARQKSDS